jgi:hypothetical protein
MSQIIPINIPTYINSEQYSPARVLPRLFFYNGLIDCETYWIESGSLAFGGVTFQQNAFPYFDNYSALSGSFPTTSSLSLLFNNEPAAYGTMPNQNLYTEYWETYINLLYNPKTRLIECAAIIPLADYINMELNDVVNFRGNYYHLRAINDYSLKTGDCNLQLLGPIIPDTFTARYPVPPTVPSASVLIHLSEYNASPTAFIDANLIVSGSPYYFSGNFTQTITGDVTADVTMELKDGGSTVWGPYTTASAQFSIYDNGSLLQSASLTVFSGSGDTDLTFPITFTAGHTFVISGSTAPVTGSTPPPTGSATLAWSFSETGGAIGEMDLYVNGNVIESRGNTSSGTYTVYVGDTINVGVNCSACDGFDNRSNAYCTGIINDASCMIDDIASIFTAVYTVQLADVGTTLNLDTFAACAGGCL